MQSGRLLVNGSDFYCGNSSSKPIQLALKSQIPDLSSYAKTSDLESLKTSVSSGKSIVASAVTDKGVNTAADASFQTIANNISSISVAPSSCKVFKYALDSDVNVGDPVALTANASDKSSLGVPQSGVGRSQVVIDDKRWVMVQSSRDSYGGQTLTLCCIDDNGNITMSSPVYPTGDRYYYGAVLYHPSLKRLVTFAYYSGIIGKIYSIDTSKNTLSLEASFNILSGNGQPIGYALDGNNLDILCMWSTTLTMASVNLLTGLYTTSSEGTISSSGPGQSLYPIGFYYGDSSGHLRYVKNQSMSNYSEVNSNTNYVLKSSTEIVQTDGNGNVIHSVSLTSDGYVLGKYIIVSVCESGLLMTKPDTKMSSSKSGGYLYFPLYYYEFSTSTVYFLGTGSWDVTSTRNYPLVQIGKWLLVSVGGVYKSSSSYNAKAAPYLFKLESGMALPFGPATTKLTTLQTYPVIGVALSNGSSGDTVDVMVPPNVI